jgi:hypothetical protein
MPNKRTPAPAQPVPHPKSPAGRNYRWYEHNLPHPDSPTARSFPWSEFSVADPESPRARDFFWIPVFPSAERDDASEKEVQPIEVGQEIIDAMRTALQRAISKMLSNVGDKLKPLLESDRLAAMAAVAAAFAAPGEGGDLEASIYGREPSLLERKTIDAVEVYREFFLLASDTESESNLDKAGDVLVKIVATTGVDRLLQIKLKPGKASL